MTDHDPHAPLSSALHGLTDNTDLVTGMPDARDVRRRGDHSRRRRTVVAGAAAALVLAGSAGAAVGLLPGPDDSAGALAGPARTSTSPDPGPPASQASSPSPTTSPSGPSAADLLTASDLAGIGLIGKQWAPLPQASSMSVSCDTSAPAPTQPQVLVGYAELGSTGKAPEGGGPVVSEVTMADPPEVCAGAGWTTVRDAGGLLVQRYNADPATGFVPWASYRMVAQAPGRSVLVSAYFGESLENDDIALQVGRAALERLQQG